MAAARTGRSNRRKQRKQPSKVGSGTPAAPLMTVGQIAEKTGSASGTIYRLLHERSVPHMRVGRKILVSWPEFIEATRVEGMR